MSTFAASITAILTNIFSSASKLVFLMVAVSLCIGLFTKHITQENFIYLAGNVFSYYFGLAVGSSTTPPHPGALPVTQSSPTPLEPAVTVSETTTKTTAPATVPGIK